ncbi:hypothetical protein TNIN_234111 [Trichonephila inaurata madagascariensis]|uniref:Uncharacterized protein n=1 Tax=Trichonephila inaurata madagascariensis TaxID=2747483 RepID=A0A8X6I585_9ARAC|nr:hypothetical protein TNIN_234111 [Trichonephila inaurata madagascariensis]
MRKLLKRLMKISNLSGVSVIIRTKFHRNFEKFGKYHCGIASISLHEGLPYSKGPLTFSALNNALNKKFEATGTLTSRQRSGRDSTATAVEGRQWSRRYNSCRWLLHMGSAVLENFRGRQECRKEVSGEHCE